MEERFWNKVNKTDTCWLWTGCLIKNGYGYFYSNGKPQLVHRVSWILSGHTIPDGHLIRHKCRNRHCCNPEHIETGTHQQNSDDKLRDGTLPRGEIHHASRLIEAQVLDIRASDLETKKLAEKYNVSIQHISKIKRRKSWKHI